MQELISTSRIPPQAVELEEAVLGSALIDRSAGSLLFGSLQTEHFYKPEHQHIFRSMLRLYMNGQPFDMMSLEQELSDEGHQIDSSYIADLTRSVSSSANIEYHCQIIKEKWIKRELIQRCNETIKDCYDSSSDTYDVLDQAQEYVFQIASEDEGRTHDIADTMNEVMTELTERMKDGKPLGLQTDLRVDELTGGFQDGKFYVIAARPSMGKTAFALEVMRRIAKSDKSVAILSLETSHISLGYRLLAQSSGVPGELILKGKLDEAQFDKVVRSAGELSSLGIKIDDTLTLTDVQFRSKARQFKQQYKIDLLVVDYVQLLTGKGNVREQEIAKVSRMCKVVAKELDIPVIALAQLSRAVEQRGGDKRPMLSDLRESGQIEQDADAVMFLYRPEYYGITANEGGSTAGICEVIVAKNKDGAVGTKVLEFDKERMRFNNIDPIMRGQKQDFNR